MKPEQWEETIFKLRKQKIRMRSERYIPTAEDWSPPYFLDSAGKKIEENRDTLEYAMVHGTVMIMPPSMTRKPRGRELKVSESHWFVRICFWGNDDSGIEKDFYFPDHESALEQYNRLVTYLGRISIVCRWDLLDLGFQPA